MVWVKNLKYSYVFIFYKISQQNAFDVILESQKAFLDYKKQKVKKVEKNLEIFPCYIFGKINQQNVFNIILESHKAFFRL